MAKTTKCVAVIQCAVAHERCPGTQCAAAFAERKDCFAEYGDEVVYYVPFTCGGCPGRRISRLVENVRRVMAKRGVEKDEIVVHLASCVVTDNGHYPPCPHVDDMRLILSRKGFRTVDGSRISPQAEQRRQDGKYRKRGE
ncbi:MAG: CGGC domain-containing protein [Planctomycetes bacterium]|nr:CGGC domain-containing protein [Planctomycetota bacterium]